MQNDALDLAFARHVRQIGLVTPEQVSAALETQSKSLQKGTPISFSEVMVQLGYITAAQRESLEKKVKEQQAGVNQFGPYKLVKKLGEGGMGAVYLATDPTSKQVAIKILPRHLSSNPEFVKRFKREAETATRLKHPNIIGAFDTGEDLGYQYYVMEFWDGETVDSLLKREKSLPVARAVDIVLQSARGLEYAHREGVIHRDIKPSNLFVTKDGTTKILDLGLSKMVDDPGQSFKTVSGAVLGTPHYISPEQAQGERNIDGRADLYSLGATLYHLLTGQTPFDGTTVLEILSKHVNTQLPNPQDLREDIPDPVVQVLERMMAKSPDDRYRDCAALIADLQEVTAGRQLKSQLIAEGLSIIAAPARRVALRKRSPATVRRMTAVKANSKTPWMVVGGVAAALLIVLIAAFMGKGSEPHEVEAPRIVKRTEPVTPPPPAHTHSVPAVKPPPPPPPKPPPDTFEIPKRAVQPVIPDKPETPIESLKRRIREANPGMEGPVTSELDGEKIVGLEFSGVGVTDLRPLSSVTTLRKLDVSGRWNSQEQREYRSDLADLGPLRGLPLEELRVHHSEVSDLSPLRGMPLRLIDLCASRITSISALQGMRLESVDISYTAVQDVAVLKGMPIDYLDVVRVSFDLNLLKTMALKTLHCKFQPDQDLRVLAELKSLESINGIKAGEFLSKTPLAPLIPPTDDAWKSAVHLLPLVVPEQDGIQGSWKFAEAGIRCEEPGDRGMDVLLLPYKPPEEYAFRIVFTPDGDKPDVTQILSRGGRAFQWINGGFGNTIFGFAVVDETSPDSSPVAIRRPVCLEPRRTSTAIVEVRKDSISAYVNGERLSLVRTAEHKLKLMPMVRLTDESRLGLLTYQCGATFHAADVLELKGRGTLIRTSRPPPPVTPEAALWKNAVDLLALVEPTRDTLNGTWKKENGKLISEPFGNGTFRLPYEPPAEYDFRIVFTRTGGKCATAQFFPRDGKCAFYEMGGYGNSTIGFANINGQGTNKNASGSPFSCKDAVKYVSTVQVRRDRATAYLDDKKVAEWTPSMGTLNCDGEWSMDVPTILGLGNCDTLTVFESILVREVTGKGRIRGTFATTPDPVALKAISSTSGEEQLKRVVAKIRELNPKLDTDDVRSKVENEKLVELTIPTGRVFDIWPVRGLAALKKLDLGDERSGVLTDISCLKGMKLQELGLANTRVYDLSALQGMPLVRLQIQGTPVRDLTLLKAMPLQKLDCDRTAVTDWSPLKGHRTLKTVNDTPLADFLKGR